MDLLKITWNTYCANGEGGDEARYTVSSPLQILVQTNVALCSHKRDEARYSVSSCLHILVQTNILFVPTGCHLEWGVLIKSREGIS